MSRDYTTGKIYRLWSPSANVSYFGHTINTLSRRLVNHRVSYRNFIDGKGHYCPSFEILKHPDYRIDLEVECPCNSKIELQKREVEIIKANDCINKNPPREINMIEYKYNARLKRIDNENRIYCDCGGTYVNTKARRLQHEKSKRHKHHIEQEDT